MHILQSRHNELMKAVTERKMCEHKTLGVTLERQLSGFEKEMIGEVKSDIAAVRMIQIIIGQVKRDVVAVRRIKRSISKKLGTKQFKELELEYLDLQKQVDGK